MSLQARLNANSRMSSKGQTTVPKEVRDALGLAEGVEIAWVVKNGAATVRRRPRLEDFAGILGKPPKGAGLRVEDMDEAIAKAIVEDFERNSR